MVQDERNGRQTKKRTHSWGYVGKSMLAGGIAGCAAKSVIAPLDRVKILFQTQNPEFKRFTGSFFGVFHAMKIIKKEFGVFALFQGHSATLLRIFPYAAIKFMAYEQYKCIVMPTKKDETWFKRALAGSLAGVTSVFFSYPLDLLRVRLAFHVKKNDIFTISNCCKQIYNEPSLISLSSSPTINSIFRLSNFYRGFFPTVWGMIPYAGFSFLSYETLKTYLKTNRYLVPYTTTQKNKKPELTSIALLVCGGISGAVAQTSAYPLEVIRRRMQVAGLTAVSDSNKKQLRLSTIGTARQIYHSSGFKGFFIGMSIGYIKVTPMFAVSFLVYEKMKKLMDIE